MTFVVEDGSGIQYANAYVSVAVADSYWESKAHDEMSALWLALTESQKEGAIVESTLFLDAEYGPQYRGHVLGSIQGLLWPRDALDDQGYRIQPLPPAIVRACCELAPRASQSRLAEDQDIDGTVKSKTETVGPLTESFTYSNVVSGTKRYGSVRGMLAPVLRRQMNWAIA